MKFDIKKYERRTFHNKPEINQKIKALYLWFDYEVSRRKLPYPNQLSLIDTWIRNFEKHELYEVIPSFKLRRGAIVKQIARGSTIKEEKAKATKVLKRRQRLMDKIKNAFLSFKSLFVKK